MLYLVDQANLRSNSNIPKNKFGLCILMNFRQSMTLDDKNHHSNIWKDFITLEREQLDMYKAFVDIGRDHKTPMRVTRKRAHTLHTMSNMMVPTKQGI